MIQENVKEKLLKQESKHTKFYNQNTKELLPLQTGEVIQVAPKQGDKQQKWFKAQMEDQVDIRSYEVRAAKPPRPHAIGQPAQENFVGQTKQTEPTIVPPEQEPPPSPNKLAAVVTRNRQVSRVPQYLQDFVSVK
ncbi:unnamed protein product [Pocillopora meandrina]|uniref:Uncharacterized protein n=1 Tax=Pocillopora meandrina TaxID=46732 RepID=A0AAU9X0I1_9CNID|nr:unnamed protein product [Pocillopora meandrina]